MLYLSREVLMEILEAAAAAAADQDNISKYIE
jgi:hypothetical protein